MCFRDVLETLRAEGIAVSRTQLRWAIDSGKVDRPPLDGSHRFVFGPQQLVDLRRYFGQRTPGRGTNKNRKG